MSVVTNQPLPIGRLEREKHIQMIFRVFQNRCRPSSECHCHSPEHKPHNTPADLESEEQLSERKMENIYMQPPGKLNRPWMEEHRPGGAAGSGFTTLLESVCKIHITARPELQGMKNMCICVLQCQQCWDLSVLKRWVFPLCRSTVCSQENLQHFHRRQKFRVVCGCGRY